MRPNGIVVSDPQFDIKAIRTLQDGNPVLAYSDPLVADPRSRVVMSFFVNEWDRSDFRIVKEIVTTIKREVHYQVIDAEEAFKRSTSYRKREYNYSL
jgi:hypothetical protein